MAQTNDSIPIEGYVIYKYKRAEIVEAKSDSTIHPIDFWQHSFFIPKDSIGILYGGLVDILRFDRRFVHTQTFIFPGMSEFSADNILEYCGVEKKIKNIFLFGGDKNTFYILDYLDSDEYIFRIKFIRGTALKCVVPHEGLNYRTLEWRMAPKSIKYFDCYFIYNILEASDFGIEQSGLKKIVFK